MKKILILAALVPAALFADVASLNTFGMNEVHSIRTNTIVSVPWTGYSKAEADASDIHPTKLVRDTNLLAGDILYLLEPSGVYRTWVLDSDRQWQALSLVYLDEKGEYVSEDANAATNRFIPRGNGIWLVRQRPLDDSGKPIPFYVYGQKVSTESATTIEAGTLGEPTWTLVGSPWHVEFDFNSGKIENADPSDQIVVPEDTGIRLYSYENGKWGYWKTTVVTRFGRTSQQSTFMTAKEDTTVPAGIGFWYISRGGAPTIRW